MSNSNSNAAWLLELGENVCVAVGERELQYLLADLPKFNFISNAPSYCNKVFVWQGEIVPVMDIAQLILGRNIIRPKQEELVVLTTFQAHVNEPLQRGAILLSAIPIKINIQDQQVCDFPSPQDIWQQLAVTCFEHPQKGPVPILNLERIFLTPASSLWSNQGGNSFAG